MRLRIIHIGRRCKGNDCGGRLASLLRRTTGDAGKSNTAGDKIIIYLAANFNK